METVLLRGFAGLLTLEIAVRSALEHLESGTFRL